MNEDCRLVLEAKDAAALFGSHEKRSKIIYRRLARSVHPDLFPDAEKKTAEKAFIKLTDLWNTHTKVATAGGTPAAAKNTIKTKKHSYSVDGEIDLPGIYARHYASYDAGYEKCQLLVVREPQDSDLAGRHIDALKKLNKDVPEAYRAFYPELLESFRYRTETNTDHIAFTQKIPEGFSTFARILEVYPEGISGRDVAWIFKRMLTAVGNAHDIGLVHGAPTLDAFLVHPEFHGVILSEWQYSVPTGETMKALPPEFASDYPTYVLDKEQVTYALDIYLCAVTAQKLLRKDAPRQFTAFFNACKLRKPLEAKHLLKEFDVLLQRLYGPPQFHAFTLNP